MILFRTIQKLTLTESSKLNEILEDIQNLICSRTAPGHPAPEQPAPMTTSSPEPTCNVNTLTPSPETGSYLKETDSRSVHNNLFSVHTNSMHLSTPDKTADSSAKTGFSMSTTAILDPTAKNLLDDFVTPTKVLDISDYS